MQAGRRGAQQAGGVGELVWAVLGLDGQGAATVSAAQVCSPLSLPPEVAVVEHLLTVGVQRPVVSFTCIRKKRVQYMSDSNFIYFSYLLYIYF